MSQKIERPIRAGVFRTVADAQRAIEGLRDAGFDNDQITVVCSDEARQRHFKPSQVEEPSGSHTAAAVAEGGTAGAILGGLASAGIATAGGVAIVAVGPILAAGAVAGGFIGAMLTRGVETETADYYDQAVTSGKILVAVEDESPQSAERLATAQRVIREAGAEPVGLREG